jgi:hypothetical protein
MIGEIKTHTRTLELQYTIICEDVRLEVGSKLTIVGVFYGIYVAQLPVSILKFAVLNHWLGEGTYLTEVRILSPDRSQAIVASRPTSLQVQANGYADNINIFANIIFPVAGEYVVQTLVDSTLYSERLMPVGILQQEEELGLPTVSDRIN